MSNQFTILDKNNKRAMGGGNVKQGLVPQSTGFYGTSGIRNMRRSSLRGARTKTYEGLRLINYNGSVTRVARPAARAPSDKTSPRVAEVTPVSSPTNNTTPTYTFSSTEAGTITYGGEVSSSTRIAVEGRNSITLGPLSPGRYRGTITVTDRAGNVSNTLAMLPFTLDTTAPVLAEITPVSTPTNVTTPTYVFSTTQNGTITYGGGVSSRTTSATQHAANTITLDALGEGTYNGTIIVTDGAGNASSVLRMSAFTIDTTAPTLTQVSPRGNPFSVRASRAAYFNFVLTSDKAGTASFSGDATSGNTSIRIGSNTLIMTPFGGGSWTAGTKRGGLVVTVTDAAGNFSALTFASFTIT